MAILRTEFKTDRLMEAISCAVKAAIDQEVSEAVKEAQEHLARRVPEIVARVGLQISGMVHVDRIGQEIRITIIDKGLGA